MFRRGFGSESLRHQPHHATPVRPQADALRWMILPAVFAVPRTVLRARSGWDEVISGLHDSDDLPAQLEQLRLRRRDAQTLPQARRLLRGLEQAVRRVPLPPAAMVTALVAAANAQQRAKVKPERQRVDLFLEAVQRSSVGAPEELSYTIWALVKLRDRGSPVLKDLLQNCLKVMPDFQAAQLSRLAWALATSSVRQWDLLDALAARTAQLELHPQQGLAMLAWSFAKLSGHMDLEHLARQARKRQHFTHVHTCPGAEKPEELQSERAVQHLNVHLERSVACNATIPLEVWLGPLRFRSAANRWPSHCLQPLRAVLWSGWTHGPGPVCRLSFVDAH